MKTEDDHFDDVDEYCEQCERVEKLSSFTEELFEQIDWEKIEICVSIFMLMKFKLQQNKEAQFLIYIDKI